METMKKAYLIFTRVPLPGFTKTRLIPALSAEGSAALHEAMLRDIAGEASQLNADLFVFHTPKDAGALKEIFPGARFHPQQGKDLGQRMHEALVRVLELGYDACVLTGTDLPHLKAEHLEAAFAALARADVALGPTYDGGYYLVGLKAPCAELFESQSYGHGSVYQNALSVAESVGKSVLSIAACDDIDTGADLRSLWQSIQNEDSHTAAFLRTVYGDDDAHEYRISDLYA